MLSVWNLASGTQLIRTISLLLLFVTVAFLDGYAFQAAIVDTSTENTTGNKFGYIQFEVEPDTVYLYLNLNYEDPMILTGETIIKLHPGINRMLIFGKSIPDKRMIFTIEEGHTQVVQIHYPEKKRNKNNSATYAAFKWNANLMLFSDDETLISIDGSNYFAYGSIRAKLSPGVHRIRFESLSGKKHEVFLEVNSYQLKTYEKYFKPTKSNSHVAGVIPGASQFYKKQPLKGISALALMGITTGLTLHYDSKLAAGKEDFYNVRQRYEQANTEQLALELGNQLDVVGSEVTGYKNRRNMFRVAAILVYAANFVDAFREPDDGFAKHRTFNPYRDFSVDFNSEFVEARVQLNF